MGQLSALFALPSSCPALTQVPASPDLSVFPSWPCRFIWNLDNSRAGQNDMAEGNKTPPKGSFPPRPRPRCCLHCISSENTVSRGGLGRHLAHWCDGQAVPSPPGLFEDTAVRTLQVLEVTFQQEKECRDSRVAALGSEAKIFLFHHPAACSVEKGSQS